MVSNPILIETMIQITNPQLVKLIKFFNHNILGYLLTNNKKKEKKNNRPVVINRPIEGTELINKATPRKSQINEKIDLNSCVINSLLFQYNKTIANTAKYLINV